jgi:DNA modification methylase
MKNQSSNTNPGPSTTRSTRPNPGTIILGDALTELKRLPDKCVDCVITSPPYYLLRNYQIDGQLGMEHSVEAYVSQIVAICDELARVLTPQGSLWINLGDSFSRHLRHGSPAKSLLLAPERILLGLTERGWLARNKVVWAKPNPTPASVRDRLNTTWEPLFLMVRTQRYYFNLGAIRVPHRSKPRPAKTTNQPVKYDKRRPSYAGPLAGSNDGLLKARAEGRPGHPLGKNPGDVWNIATASFHGAHFATFPIKLAERPLLASCPERVCRICGAPWVGQTPACACNGPWRPGIVLDPFMGSGTVGVVATRHGRDWLGIELNPEYAQIAVSRIRSAQEEVTNYRKQSA